jgi:hypothetical protein
MQRQCDSRRHAGNDSIHGNLLIEINTTLPDRRFKSFSQGKKMVSRLFRGNLDYGRIVHWKADRPKRMLGRCPNRVIDPVDAARFMTAASTS